MLEKNQQHESKTNTLLFHPVLPISSRLQRDFNLVSESVNHDVSTFLRNKLHTNMNNDRPGCKWRSHDCPFKIHYESSPLACNVSPPVGIWNSHLPGKSSQWRNLITQVQGIKPMRSEHERIQAQKKFVFFYLWTFGSNCSNFGTQDIAK